MISMPKNDVNYNVCSTAKSESSLVPLDHNCSSFVCLPAGSNSLGVCFNQSFCWSVIALIKHHAKSNLNKKELISSYNSQVMVCN